MDSPKITLRQALTRQKPYLLHSSKPPQQAARSIFWPRVQGLISVWHHFKIQCLNESYGPLLDLSFPDSMVSSLPPVEHLANMAVDNPSILAWLDSVLRPTLAFAKNQLELHRGIRLQHFIRTSNGSDTALSWPQIFARFYGHVVVLENYARHALVVGLDRSSTNWDSSNLVKDAKTEICAHLWPVRYLASLCRKSACRYGYIRSKTALVVFCFAIKPRPATSDGTSGAVPQFEVLFMPVPWDTESSGHVLTPELALWWLCMLSLNENGCALVEMSQIVPINTWINVALDDGIHWVRRHYYSGLNEQTSVPLPPSIPTGMAPPSIPGSGTDLGLDFLDLGADFDFSIPMP